MSKRLRMSPGERARLRSYMLRNRRKTLYKMTAEKNSGIVPCFVCGRHVLEQHASLEHVIPRSHGGTDEMNNLAISHARCNNERVVVSA